MSLRIAVQAEAFDVAGEMARLSLPGVGGIGSFIGIVRGGAGLTALTLEHYPAMTERAIGRIAGQAMARFDLLGCTVLHRIGRLPVGAPIVLVLTACAHRGPALQATGFLIDWLKTAAPFWKCEHYDDGTRRWVEARASDDLAARRWHGPVPP